MASSLCLKPERRLLVLHVLQQQLRRGQAPPRDLLGASNGYSCEDQPTCSTGQYLKGASATATGTCTTCSNDNCAGGSYRTGSCSGASNGYSCNTCSNANCGSGAYRAGSCSGTSNGYGCTTCANANCASGKYRGGSCSAPLCACTYYAPVY